MSIILVTGSNGLIGQAIKEQSHGHDFVFTTRQHIDLTQEPDVDHLIGKTKPDCIIHCAARVGGIGANALNPAAFYRENILMNTNVVHYAHKHQVKKLLALSSVCVFSGKLEVLKEEDMHKDEPYHLEFGYGFAKRGLDIHIRSLNVKNYTSLILTNIFGKNDSYNLTNGHVIPSLIHKIYLAKKNNTPLCVWGTGRAKREFLYAGDLAKIILKLVDVDLPQRILISRDEEVSIRYVVESLVKLSGFAGEVIWQTEKPEGQMSRRADLTTLKSLIDVQYTDFYEALKESYFWFENNFERARK